MNLQLFLLLAAALLSIGIYGALSQQSIVMIMMGLELMINAVVVAASAFWFYLSPARPDGQVLVLVALAAMAVEMARATADVAGDARSVVGRRIRHSGSRTGTIPLRRRGHRGLGPHCGVLDHAPRGSHQLPRGTAHHRGRG